MFPSLIEGRIDVGYAESSLVMDTDLASSPIFLTASDVLSLTTDALSRRQLRNVLPKENIGPGEKVTPSARHFS